jgi:signal peptidase I
VRSTLKFLLAFAIAMMVMMAFRALVFTVFTIPGNRLSPVFQPGDRVMVNRWSYGLRTGGAGSIFSYGRLCQQSVEKGDLVAINDSTGSVQVCRCKAQPGDTLHVKGRILAVPGVYNCAQQDYYWMESVDGREAGMVAEEQVMGRVFLIVYNHDDRLPFWRGFDRQRLLLLP